MVNRHLELLLAGGVPPLVSVVGVNYWLLHRFDGPVWQLVVLGLPLALVHQHQPDDDPNINSSQGAANQEYHIGRWVHDVPLDPVDLQAVEEADEGHRGLHVNQDLSEDQFGGFW